MVGLRVVRIRADIDRAAAAGAARAHGLFLVSEVTRLTFNRANVLTPVDTGNLRTHNRMRVNAGARTVRGEVFNDAKYAAAVHDGSVPHVIRARRRKALRFRIGGRVLFRRQVNHPGNRGRPWLARAGQETAVANGFVWTPG